MTAVPVPPLTDEQVASLLVKYGRAYANGYSWWSPAAIEADVTALVESLSAARDELETLKIDLGTVEQNLEYVGDERDAYRRERDEALAQLERFQSNAEILSASTIGEAFDRIEEIIAERDQARELAETHKTTAESMTLSLKRRVEEAKGLRAALARAEETAARVRAVADEFAGGPEFRSLIADKIREALAAAAPAPARDGGDCTAAVHGPACNGIHYAAAAPAAPADIEYIDVQWGVRHANGHSVARSEGEAREWVAEATGPVTLIRRTVTRGAWRDAATPPASEPEVKP